ncbi:MAG: MmgE/PrpD family protein [Lachnospiraceae bacterium]|nr:MmgE/PrpD family protein [Lachnospiraceae bacterium]
MKSRPEYLQMILNNITQATFDDLAEDAVENVKRRLIDISGCIIGGMFGFKNKELAEMLFDWGGKEEALVFMYGKRIPVVNAGFINCILARSYDYGTIRCHVKDIFLPSHMSETTVPTTMTLADMTQCSGKEAAVAMLLGDDFAGRMLAASGFGFAGGWDNVGQINSFGATVIASRLLKLNQQQSAQALGICLNQICGTFQAIYDGTSSFKLLQGYASRNGILSANLAKIGETGAEDPLLSRFGYYAKYTGGCERPELLTEDMGKVFYYEDTFKSYSCCRSTHDAIEATLKLVSENQFDVEDIDKVVLLLPQFVLDMFVAQPFEIRYAPQIDAAFNVRYCTANVLMRKSIELEHFTEKMVLDPKLHELIKRIDLVELKNPFTIDLGAGIRVYMKDGTELKADVDFPKGEPGLSEATKEEIISKFWRNVDFSSAISKEKGQKILDTIDNLENLENFRELTDLLIAD